MNQDKEPKVHAALFKPTHLRHLANKGRLPQSIADETDVPELKKPESSKPESKTGLVAFEKLKSRKFNTDVRQQAVYRAKLKTLHDSVPEFQPEEVPPCDTCKTTPCCVGFVVYLTEEEYKSGIYGKNAVEITPEVAKQIQFHTHLGYEDTTYVLEGAPGVRCEFLDDNNNCSIYKNRPYVCRSYTCIGDDRINEDVRQGRASMNGWDND